MDMRTDGYGRQHVAEAALPLLDGETVELFRCALEDALRKAYMMRGIEPYHFYQEDLHGDFVLVRVRSSNPMQGANYERIPYSRGADGSIVLGAPVAVRPTHGAEPLGGTPLAGPDVEGGAGGGGMPMGEAAPAAEAAQPGRVRESMAASPGRSITEARRFLRRAATLGEGRGQAETAAEALIRSVGPEKARGLVDDLADVRAGRLGAVRARHIAEGLIT